MKTKTMAILSGLLTFVGCNLTPDPREVLASLPLEVPAPADNPTTPAAVALGRALFWDPIVSGDGDVACATCHHPDFAYSDGLTFPVGVGGHFIVSARNTPSLVGVAFNGLTVDGQPPPELAPMFWDSRTRSLEAQVFGPMTNLHEMRGAAFGEDEIVDEVVSRLAAIPEYVSLFEAAFGEGSVNAMNLAKAIAAFERTLVPKDSSFDRFMAGDDDALSNSQIRGMHGFLFQGCAHCHSGPMFSDYQLHDLNVPFRVGETTDRKPRFDTVFGAFRTPSLRMVTRTAPYLHNGLTTTLSEALDFYHNIDHFVKVDPLVEGDVEPAHGQGDDMINFLEALSDGTFDTTIPERVPSGLPPGGAQP